MYKNNSINYEELSTAYNKDLNYIGKINQSKLENVLYFRDAVLEELAVTSEVDSDVTFDCSSIAGDLLSGESKSGTITVTWNADSVSSQKDVNFNAEIVARQKV